MRAAMELFLIVSGASALVLLGVVFYLVWENYFKFMVCRRFGHKLQYMYDFHYCHRCQVRTLWLNDKGRKDEYPEEYIYNLLKARYGVDDSQRSATQLNTIFNDKGEG